MGEAASEIARGELLLHTTPWRGDTRRLGDGSVCCSIRSRYCSCQQFGHTLRKLITKIQAGFNAVDFLVKERVHPSSSNPVIKPLLSYCDQSKRGRHLYIPTHVILDTLPSCYLTFLLAAMTTVNIHFR